MSSFGQVLLRGIARVSQLEEMIASVIVWVVVLVIVAGAVARYLFRSPIVGTYDIARYGFTLLVAFGLAAAERAKKHVRVDALVSHLGSKTQAILAVGRFFLVFACCAIGTLGASMLALDSLAHNVRSENARIPMVMIQGGLALGFLTFGVTTLVEASQVLIGLRQRKRDK